MKELIEKIARQREIIDIYKKELETMKSLRDQAEGDTRDDLSCEVMEIIEKIEDCELTIIKYKRIEEIRSEIKALENTDINELIEDMEDRYSDMLDECFPEVKIGYCSFNPSRIMRELDPTAFRCGVNDYADSLASDIQNLPEWECIESQIYELNEELEELEEGDD